MLELSVLQQASVKHSILKQGAMHMTTTSKPRSVPAQAMQWIVRQHILPVVFAGCCEGGHGWQYAL